jgi:hypothetical protein
MAIDSIGHDLARPGFDSFQVGKQRRRAEVSRGMTVGGYVAFEQKGQMLGRQPILGTSFRARGGVAGGKPAQQSALYSMTLSRQEIAGPTEALQSRMLLDVDGDGLMADEMGVAGHMVVGQGDETAKNAKEVLDAAAKLKEEGKLLRARSGYTFAYLLDSSLAAYWRSNGETSTKALEAIEEINKALTKGWSKELPGLEKRLDFVIRNKSVAEALEAVAKAAGIEIALVPGSVEDAAGITRRREVRVTYLDLRNATAAQALDWILVPARMTWWAADGKVTAGTVRRSAVKSPWVYDVSLIALPAAKELEEIEDQQKRFEAATQEAERFVNAVRGYLKLGEDAAVWYGPGQVLVFAAADVHEKAARLFRDLADPEAKLEGALAELHEVTSRRAEERRETAAKLLAEGEKLRVARALSEYSWRLLAEAADGRLDLEALTELQSAWARPETAELPEGKGRVIAIRSMWALAEAAEALPEEKELIELAESAVTASQDASSDALEALRKSPEDLAAYFTVLYAALGRKVDATYPLRAKTVLMQKGEKDSALAQARVIAEALLTRPDRIDGEALMEVVAKGVQGDDMVVLTALACRRAGGEAWEKFREEARTLLGDQPLSGSVVVLVNRLSRGELKLASAYK